MDKVNIYIDVVFRGRANEGTGVYTAVLEYIDKDNIPHTKEMIQGILKTTKNRTSMIACIDALERFTRPCDITLYINNNYVVQSINHGYSKEKNQDLWMPLLLQGIAHQITYEYSVSNSYTSYMQTRLKHMEIDFKEDKENV